MRIVAIVPARAGSKGVPKKNSRIIGGQPLISWTILAAQRAQNVDEVIVTTDDEDIAKIARGLGVNVPFMRPAHLAQDDTPGIEPVMHALSVTKGFDAAVLLQPTSPLRTTADIDAAIELAQVGRSVVSVCETREPIQWAFEIKQNGSLERVWSGELATRRQEVPTTYTLNGAVYFFEIPWLLTGGTLIDQDTLAYVMPPERSIDIDSDFDWLVAEFLLSRSV